MRASLLACALGAAAALVGRRGAAEEIDLVWDAPPACPSREVVLEQAWRRGLRRSWRPSGTAPVVRAIVRGDAAQGWLLALRFERPNDLDARAIPGVACDSLAFAAAVVLAELFPEAPPPSPPVVRPAVPRWHVTARAAGAVVWTATPGLSPGLDVGLGLRRGAWQLEAFATHLAPSEARDPVGGLFELAATSGGLRGCRAFRFERVELGPCVSVDGGVLAATPRNRPTLVAASAPWLTVAADARFAWWFHEHLGLLLGVRVGVNVVRARFRYVVEDTGSEVESYAQPLLRAQAELGLITRWP
ncbi:MAG: hypothetical protein U0324_38850 [Polyangiales bacterium]